jgi:pimeloyl-ACP methyl ester carboxylesterase
MSDTQLRIVPPPVARRVKVADRGSFYVRVANEGSDAPAVVLLHGLAGSADLNWSTTIPMLGGDFRVVAPDLRGHGSTRTSSDHFTLEAAADDVAALADALQLDSFITVGYSMGGAVAQLLARRHPEKLRGLVLCATSRSFRATFREHLMFAAVPSVRNAARAIPNDVACRLAQRIASRVVGNECAAKLDQTPRNFNLRSVLEAASALAGFQSYEWISEVDVPAAVLVHLRDQLVPPDRQFALAHAIAKSVVCPVDGDHFAAVQRPAAFVPTVARAVRTVHQRAELAAAVAV